MIWYLKWSTATSHGVRRVAGYGRDRLPGFLGRCVPAIVAFLFHALIAAPAQAQFIAVFPTQDLEFGTVAPDVAISGTVIVDPATGTKTVTGGVFDFGGAHTPADFTVLGQQNTPFTITLAGSVILASGGNTMTLNGFTSDPTVGFIDNNWTGSFSVGATLQVGANQPAGTYSGVFDVTVNY